MLETRRGSKGARMRRRPLQSTPLKKSWALISVAPAWPEAVPRRLLAEQRRLFWFVSMRKRGSLGRDSVKERKGIGGN